MENYKKFVNDDLIPLLFSLEDVIEKFYAQNYLDGEDMNMVLGLMHSHRSLDLYIKGLKLHGNDN